MTEPLERKIDRLNAKVTEILKQSKEEKVTWVKSSVITRLAGWNKYDMAKARNYNYVTWKKDERGFWYALESLNPALYKNK